MNDIDPSLLLSLTDALNLIPGIRSGKARELLRSIQDDLLDQYISTAPPKPPSRCLITVRGDWFVRGRRKTGLGISLSEWNRSFGPERASGAQTITPDGASLLLRLYEEGALPLSKQDTEEDPTELRLYAHSSAELQERTQMLRAESLRAAEAWQQLVENPELVTEDQFSIGLLNQIFWRALGPSHEAMLKIGGIQVTKHLTRCESNSGKSADYRLTFSWMSPAGTAREIVRESTFQGNRANDPDRSYGLGRKFARS